MTPLFFANGVTFANPAGLLALALVAPVVALHLYRRRRRRVEVAFLPLLREVAGTTSAQGAWKNVHETLSLLLRCAALAAAALALAGPRPAHAGEPPRDLVIVIDADVTTEAVEERRPGCTTTRFGRELALAEALMDANGAGRTSLIVAGDVPYVGATRTRNRADVRRLPYDPWVLDARGDLAAAIAAAKSRARDARIVVLTSRALPPGADAGVEVLGAGSATDDQGIVDQAVESAPNGARRTVRVTLRNFAGAPRTRRLVAKTDAGDVALQRDVEMPARGEVEVVFDVLPPRGGTLLSIALEGEDALAWDDRTGLWLAPLARPSVLVVHGGTVRPFVTAILDAMGETIDREASGSVPAKDAAKATPRDVTIVDGVALPAGTTLAGGWIFLAPFGSGGALPFTAGRIVQTPLVWRQDAAHALLRGVDLTTAYVARGTTLSGADSEGLAFAEGEPVVAEGPTPQGGRWIAFGLDPDGSDLPLRAALPVLLRNAIRGLGKTPADVLKPFYRAGETIPFGLRLFRAAAEPERSRAVGPCGEPPATLSSPSRSIVGTVPAGRRGEKAEVVVSHALSGIRDDSGTSTTQRFVTAFVDLSRDVDVTPVRPAATPPPPAPPAPEEDAVAALWRAILIAAAAALLLADLLLLAVRGSADRRGIVAATPAKA